MSDVPVCVCVLLCRPAVPTIEEILHEMQLCDDEIRKQNDTLSELQRQVSDTLGELQRQVSDTLSGLQRQVNDTLSELQR